MSIEFFFISGENLGLVEIVDNKVYICDRYDDSQYGVLNLNSLNRIVEDIILKFPKFEYIINMPQHAVDIIGLQKLFVDKNFKLIF